MFGEAVIMISAWTQTVELRFSIQSVINVTFTGGPLEIAGVNRFRTKKFHCLGTYVEIR
jgi:hypothetical protein